ncbi:MAG: BatD family protein [Methylococcales bacterium]|nr:BatD family protein [Methylococcales bacterium]
MNTVQILILNLLLLFMPLAQAADIQVSVDRNPVSINTSFQIIFTAGQTPDDNPDFSPLQESFQILDQQRSSKASWINGHTSRTEQWTITVMAKQPGEMEIPAIAFGSDHSKPLKLTVTENRQTPQNNEDLFMEVTASPENPYVQSQVLYTLRLYRRIQIAQARLDDPQIKDAVVEKLGEDSTYSTQLQGVDYWVTERKYAIFPQHSGSVTIAPLKLSAEVLSSHRSRFGGFFSQQTTETRNVTSKAITLDVQPVPASFKNMEWLSAQSLQLSDGWSDKSLQTRVGEPLTRTIRLVAKAATVGQLPELSNHLSIDGMKTYADQPILKEDKTGDGLTASREEKIAFIPSRPGNYTLPAIEINWFNTQTRHIEKATLPSVTINALPSRDIVPPQPAGPEAENHGRSEVQPPAAATVAEHHEQLRIWQGLCAGLATGWILTLIIMYRKLHKPRPTAEVTEQPAPTAYSAIEKSLKHACWENRPYTAKQLLLQWGKARYEADSLGGIARLCATPLREEIELLNQHLYSGEQQPWNGQPLWQAFSQLAEDKTVKSGKPDGLEPLHKL